MVFGRRARRRMMMLVGTAAALCLPVVMPAGAAHGAAGRAPALGDAAPSLTDPSAGHPYRHGVIPRRIVAVLGGSRALSTGSFLQVAHGHPLVYGGGPVVTGRPRVYLVFWGSQWGSESSNHGYLLFSGDPVGAATDLQGFFAGLGSDNEQWSTMAGRYCDGISVGSVACPLSAPHVPYPSGGVLAGVWEDTSFTPATGTPGSPSTPGVTGKQIAQEAAAASVHFADTSTNAQYVIVSPTGTNPDGWDDSRNGYCAYHNSTRGFSLPGPDVAYTNLPYVTDAPGAGCSAGVPAVPSGSDAVTETAGHEYYETLTDGFQTTAWLDANGNEIGDKCEYLGVGVPGGYFNLILSTGTFAVQGMWANSANNGHGACVDSQSPIVVDNPGKQLMTRGSAVSLQITAADLLPGQTLRYTAAQLPSGLSVNAASGLISGVPTGTGTGKATVTVADSSNRTGITFSVVVKK